MSIPGSDVILKLPQSRTLGHLPPSLVGHIARYAPSDTCEICSKRATPGASKFMRCGLSTTLVVLPGFEPGQTEPKTVVLPLHHKTILCLQRLSHPRVAPLKDLAKLLIFSEICLKIRQIFLRGAESRVSEGRADVIRDSLRAGRVGVVLRIKL